MTESHQQEINRELFDKLRNALIKAKEIFAPLFVTIPRTKAQ